MQIEQKHSVRYLKNLGKNRQAGKFGAEKLQERLFLNPVNDDMENARASFFHDVRVALVLLTDLAFI